MKKPYLNEEQRLHIRVNTYYGAKLQFNLAYMQFIKSVRKSHGFIFSIILDYYLKRIKLNK